MYTYEQTNLFTGALSDTVKGPENAISRVTVSENAIKTNRVMDLCPNVKKSKF